MIAPVLEALFAPAFSALGADVTWLELVAFGLAIAMVVCNLKVIVWGWPLAIASSLLYFLLFWRHRLYGDASLQVVFVVVAAWGWREWLRGRDAGGAAIAVHVMGRRGRLAAVAAILLAWPALALFLHRFTDTDVPWWDAFPTAGSLVGQFLLGRKCIENWAVWLVVNVVATGLFAWKGLWLTVLLYAVFAAMSVLGWIAWTRRLRKAGPQPARAPAPT